MGRKMNEDCSSCERSSMYFTNSRPVSESIGQSACAILETSRNSRRRNLWSNFKFLELGFDLRKLMKWLSSLAINYNQIITPNFVVQIIIWSSLTATLRRRTRLNRLVIVQSALL